MAYTPVNWQTGDTITADRLNRMDRGWGFEETELFSETVATVAGQSGNSATLAYSTLIDVPTITVTFDGTDYVCNVIDFMFKYYGGFTPTGLDPTHYPFYIESTGQANNIYTETAGTHTIAVSYSAITTSADFGLAVSRSLPILKVVLGVTTFQAVSDALNDGLLVYGWDNDNGRVFYAVATSEDSGKYFLQAITKQPGTASTIEITDFSASSLNSPLYAV